MKRLIALVPAALLLAACIETSGPPGPAPGRMGPPSRGLDSATLAARIDSRRMMLAMLPAAASGIVIRTPDGAIDRSDAARVRADLERAQAADRAEALRRGSARIAGRYRARMTEACSRVPSWTLFVSQGASLFRIRQDGYAVTLVQSKPGDPRGMEMPGVIVGMDLAFRDPLNSDFLFRGVATATGLTIRPDPSVLRSWPAWANPPARRDIVACVVTLARA